MTPARAGGLRIVVPMPPNLANRPMHYMVRNRLKVGYWSVLDWLLLSDYDDRAIRGFMRAVERCRIRDLRRQLAAVTSALSWPAAVTPRPDVPWPRATIRSTMYLGAPMDDGNAMNRHKWCEDWLTTRGFLVDDRRDVLTWESFPEQVVKRGQAYRIEVTLTRLPSGGSQVTPR